MNIKVLDSFEQTTTAAGKLEWRESANGEVHIVTTLDGVVSESLASEDPVDKVRLAGFFMRIAYFCSQFPGTPSIALIGGGTFLLPRALVIRQWKGKIDVYEKEPGIIGEIQTNPMYTNYLPNWNIIEGDYRQNLSGTYNILVYDIGEDPDLTLLNSHLEPEGLLLGID